MTKDEIVKYWIDSSEADFQTMESLYDKGHYVWALFVAHLVIEKLLKAHYVRNVDNNPPLIHHLLRLAEQISRKSRRTICLRLQRSILERGTPTINSSSTRRPQKSSPGSI